MYRYSENYKVDCKLSSVWLGPDQTERSPRTAASAANLKSTIAHLLAHRLTTRKLTFAKDWKRRTAVLSIVPEEPYRKDTTQGL
jgi:hypothetical protein